MSVAIALAGGELGKEALKFRNISDYDSNPRIRAHYSAMRKNQTLAFARRMAAMYAPETFGKRPVTDDGAKILAKTVDGHGRRLFSDEAVAAARNGGLKCSVRALFAVLGWFCDASDPDTEFPNLVHMLQTAERARAAGEPDWLVLTCLLHDIGKACFIFGSPADGQEGTVTGAQWALGGDTWVAGCALPPTALYAAELNSLNPDAGDETLSSPLGIYKEGCGLDKLTPIWGHDEYVYLWALANDVKLPREALACLRWHSCYPLHEHGEYQRFFAEGDAELVAAVRRFQKFDLYSKGDAAPDVEALWPYYQALIDKFVPGGDAVKW